MTANVSARPFMSIIRPRAGQHFALRRTASVRGVFSHQAEGLMGVSRGHRQGGWLAGVLRRELVCAGTSHACHDVALAVDANVLILHNATDIDAFGDDYGERGEWHRGCCIRWPDVAARYDGMIIAPYVWSRRLDGDARWYYGWDCASGCIWNTSAIKSVSRLLSKILATALPRRL